MSDLVQRLRQRPGYYTSPSPLPGAWHDDVVTMQREREDAANEIERLKSEMEFWRQRAGQFERAVLLIRAELSEDQQMLMARICRKTGGPCFCGCHTSVTMGPPAVPPGAG